MKTSPRAQFSLKEKKQRNKTKCEIFLGEQNVRFENPLGAPKQGEWAENRERQNIKVSKSGESFQTI